jgi:hypothetical protein
MNSFIRPVHSELPLVLLDFDGVFNALGILMGMSPWEDGRNHQATMPSGTHGFSYSPTVASFITENSHRAEFRWMSTWFEETPAYGEAMGMPALDWVGLEGLSDEPSAPWWKFVRLVEISGFDPNRRILWIDDEIPADPQDIIRIWLDEHQDQVRFIRPNDLHGLQQHDLDAISSFLP